MTGQAQQLNAGAPAGIEQFRQPPTVLTSPLIASDGGAVAEQPALSFGGLLRQLRTQARLTQEELAEAARLSPRSVSDLERGISRTARKDTARRLAEGLNLTGPEHEVFVAAARGRTFAAEVPAARSSAAPGAFAAAATRGSPGDFASFTGRYAELEQVLRALTRAVADGVVVVVIHPGSGTRNTCRSRTPAVLTGTPCATATSIGLGNAAARPVRCVLDCDAGAGELLEEVPPVPDRLGSKAQR